MKISVIQYDPVWENKSANLVKLEDLISPLGSTTDLVILPEMFSTGFSSNAGTLNEPPYSVTFEWMKSLSSRGNFGICGSYIVAENNNFYNRFVFISPEGMEYSYDKRHLFSPGNEERTFTRGKRRIVFAFRGVRICPNICYDLRFPVWSRNRNDYDLLINSASWPEARMDVWSTLLKARAIENQCFVAGANRTGIDGTGTIHSGGSVILGPRGETLASDSSGRECIVTAEISIEELNDFRSKFAVQNDADDFTVNFF
jgi:omega-amidase